MLDSGNIKNLILIHLKIHMSSIQDLIAQRQALDKQIAELQQQQRSDAISKALALIKDFELTQHDLFGGTRSAQKIKAVSKVAAKYHDPESGKEWSGRGVTPKWLRDKDKEQFLIAK